jgi:hypothetical protein
MIIYDTLLIFKAHEKIHLRLKTKRKMAIKVNIKTYTFMKSENWKPISIIKLVSILIGTLSIVLGFLLFKAGIDTKAGNAFAKVEGVSMSINEAAPGTFFVLIGLLIILITILRRYRFKEKREIIRKNGSKEIIVKEEYNFGSPCPPICPTEEKYDL